MTSARRLITRLVGSGTALLIARLIVGGTLVYASIDKLGDPVSFLKAVKEYDVVPVEWHTTLNSIAVIVPWIELLGGVALILGVGLHGIGGVLCAMLAGFTALIALRAWGIIEADGTPFFEVQFNCGCGTGSEIIWIKLLENTGLIVLSLLTAVSSSRNLCLSSLAVATHRRLRSARKLAGLELHQKAVPPGPPG